MNCYNFVIEFEHNGQFGHEEHQLTLKEGERFVGFAMVVVSERDETGNDAQSKQIKDESGILMQ